MDHALTIIAIATSTFVGLGSLHYMRRKDRMDMADAEQKRIAAAREEGRREALIEMQLKALHDQTRDDVPGGQQ